MIRVFDDFESTSSSEPELLGANTCKANLFPCNKIVSLLCGSNSLAIFFQMNVAESEFGVVVGDKKEQFCCLVKTFSKTTIANILMWATFGPLTNFSNSV